MTDRLCRESFTERALSNYTPVPEAGCWLWLGRVCTKGYGQCIRNGRSVMAHRLFYSTHNGEIPPGQLVCHKCDTRLCVNPSHLFLGSHDENMSDMTNKGRQASLSGSSNGRARLDEADVASIRASSEPTRILLRRFGVSRRTIQYIRNGTTWRES
ncbi:HNH endonuclease signature motif containing protein [Lysobacter antibioticus]|uniref:HNH endonuclease signature motif containing protein n=1 Tax=Lysobacter antibioticus TaxID=84531 RepID=UPI0009E79FDC